MGNRHRVGSPWLVVAGAAAGLLAEANYRRLPRARLGEAVEAGKVSIIIPARNEAERLGTLLRSLRRLNYVNYEVVVVDDESDDGTPQLAAHLGATVLSVQSLPPGWTGKTHACSWGASHTTGEWLLFTDADTDHHPGSLSAAIQASSTFEAGLLSLLCRQQCRSFWERLLLPYAYALYFVGRLRVNASERSAVANGQYILIRRAEYERIGGHDAVRGSVIDDVALARRAYACGSRVVLLRGEELVAVRMYEGLPSLWEGLSKNAVDFVTVAPAFGALTVASSLVFGAALPRALRGGSPLERTAVYAAPTFALLPWMRRFGVPSRYALLYPLAAATFQLIALDSIRSSLFSGGHRWKGRRY